MKIGLITNFFGGKPEETNLRIRQEAGSLGHECHLLDVSDFGIKVKDSKLYVDEVPDNYDLYIVRAVFKSMKPVATLVQTLREKGKPVFDNNFCDHKYLIDKVSDLIKLSTVGVNLPDTTYARSFEKIKLYSKSIGYPLIFKNIRKGQGAGVFKFEDRKSFFRHLDDLEAKEENARSYMIQEFIDYKFDLRVLIIGDKHFVMRRIPPKGDFRANFSLGGSVEPFNISQKGLDISWKAMKSVGLSVAGVDLLIDNEDKHYVLEVNHTPGMVGIEEALSRNVVVHYVKHALKTAV